ncbi:MAG: cob(I)yrinic acid a,c-diamide adenosyltransferase [Candidatus Lernaella stagnicola]|nr:cob(I)yrinic acid a,c-diamide adenosyltransferase [Candidatus Lernaella stagnicola]
MGSQIYTRKGDKGQTSLVDNRRVSKDSLRVQAYGTIDEANSWVGVARACTQDSTLGPALTYLQNRFFNCSSNLATPPDSDITPPGIAPEDVAFLEEAIDHFEKTTGPLSRFILPGGSQCAAFLHVARTVCRRAERLIVTLAAAEDVDPLVQKFINRSSDFLFAAARFANASLDRDDAFWDADLPRPNLNNRND